MLNKQSLSYVDGLVPTTPGQDLLVVAHVQSISICDTGTSITMVADSTGIDAVDRSCIAYERNVSLHLLESKQERRSFVKVFLYGSRLCSVI
jgi:hypothetical protein